MTTAASDNRAELAAALIRVLEGCRLVPYRDGGAVLTIGYGHTGSGIVEGVAITQEQANEWLVSDSAPLFALVTDKPAVAAAAYVSAGYNLGIGHLRQILAGTSTLTSLVHDKHGTVLPGLVARRNLEQALIDSTKGET